MSVIDRLLGRKPAPSAEHALRLVEGVESVWNYHLAFGPEIRALCNPGRTMMSTGIPLAAWGHRDHIPSSYCRECERLAIARDLGLPEQVRRPVR